MMLTNYTANHTKMAMKTYLVKERKRQQLTVAQLAQNAGVPYGTLRKFESSGNISLSQFLMLMEALNKLEKLHQLANTPGISRMEQMLEQRSRQG